MKENLPAISAIATAAAVSSTITTTTAATASTTAPASAIATASAAATAAAVAATTAAATGAFRLRPRFVYHQIPPTKILTVEGSNCLIRLFIVGDFNEGESTRLPCEAVTNQTD